MLRVGIDLVAVSRIAESLEKFGDKFLERIYTAGEIEYARAAPALTTQRLAARFAAKEAAFKALGIFGWKDVEVANAPSGECKLVLHGEAARAAGGAEVALSLSHEGDLATAVVVTNTGTP